MRIACWSTLRDRIEGTPPRRFLCKVCNLLGLGLDLCTEVLIFRGFVHKVFLTKGLRENAKPRTEFGAFILYWFYFSEMEGTTLPLGRGLILAGKKFVLNVIGDQNGIFAQV